MKRIILFSSLFLSVSFLGFAQRKFEVKHNGSALSNNSVVEISTVETIGSKLVMYFRVEVTNTSGSEIRMKMEKNPQTVMENTSNTICWEACMGPNDLSASSFPNFASGTTQTPVYAEFELNAGGEAVSGVSIVSYTFKTTTKGDEELKVEVRYKYEKPVTPPTEPEEPVTPPTGVEQVSDPNALVIYSGNGFLTLNTAKPQTVDIYKIDGVRVRSLKLDAGTTTLTDLPKSVYIVNGQKIVIR